MKKYFNLLNFEKIKLKLFYTKTALLVHYL